MAPDRERDARLTSALRLGALVLDELLPNGDTLRSASRKLRLAPSTLQRYVAITQLCRRIGRSGFRHLGVSHLKLVLPVDEAEQDGLLSRAEAGRWTVARLRREIGTNGTAGPPSALPRLVAWVASPRRRGDLGALDGAEPEEILALVQALQADLTWLEERLGSRRSGG